MHRLSASILYASNAFQNKNVTIDERVFVSLPPYYIEWLKRSFPNFYLNQYDVMNIIKGTKQSGKQCNRIFDAVVTIIKYKKSMVYHSVYIKALSDVTVYYLIVSIDDVLNTTNNYT